MNQQGGFDYNQLRKEAQTRWLKPPEILYILQNHEKYPISPQVPQKPPSGSLFLFNRRVLRYFRKDGHNWRKKKDGRNVGEAHENLKVANVDALNCYYAHGEQNPYFQRRSYWMLDPAYSHIVLVHYREVSEGRFLSGSTSNMSPDSCSTFNQSTAATNNHQGITSGTSEQWEPNGGSPATLEEVSSEFSIGKTVANHMHNIDKLGNSDLTPQPEISLALRKLKMQLSLEDNDDNILYNGEKYTAFSNEYDESQNIGVLDHNTTNSLQDFHENLSCGTEYWPDNQSGMQDGYGTMQAITISGPPEPNWNSSLGDNGNLGNQLPVSSNNIEMSQSPWNTMLEFSSGSTLMNNCRRTPNLPAPVSVLESSTDADGQTSKFPSSASVFESSISGPSTSKLYGPYEKPDPFAWSQFDHREDKAENNPIRNQFPESDLSFQLSAAQDLLLGLESPIRTPNSVLHLSKVQMQNTCRSSVFETNRDATRFRKQSSTDWMASIDFDVPNDTCSSDLSEMWFDEVHLDNPLREDSSLTVAEKPRFSIREISPEWSFCHESTKVIITGDFLCNSSECPWSVMFGDIQVPAEVVQEGVLRCMTPQHGDGKVTLCIMSGNREFCSEIREFEFRSEPTASIYTGTQHKEESRSNHEELLLLVYLVHMLLRGSDGLSTCDIGTKSTPKAGAHWSQITESLQVGSDVPLDTISWIIQELLTDKLQQWLSSKKGKDCPLTKQEQGIIHLISGLGYVWALNPILESGVGINFRDVNGWTALHWAARFGREEMVAALLAAGASAGAVTDPTPEDPVGKSAGALASANGHKGLAGYLSEADLTSHLCSLTVGESEISEGPAEVEAERAVQSISQRSVQMHVGGTADELSLKDALAAARNATQAAARIQAAFRAHSFRKRQESAATSQDGYGMTSEDMLGFSSKSQRVIHSSRDQKFDKAALSIQKKYRGWKGRRDYLTLRQHVVKIQAHVRGYQERKKFKEFVWTVSVVEKVVLRWRRKGTGLRGYRAEPELIDEGSEEVEDIVKVFRKQKVDAAVDQAVTRVLSMVDCPTSRQQYRRMLERYSQAKAELSTSDEATSRLIEDSEILESDDLMY